MDESVTDEEGTWQIVGEEAQGLRRIRKHLNSVQCSCGRAESHGPLLTVGRLFVTGQGVSTQASHAGPTSSDINTNPGPSGRGGGITMDQEERLLRTILEAIGLRVSRGDLRLMHTA